MLALANTTNNYMNFSMHMIMLVYFLWYEINVQIVVYLQSIFVSLIIAKGPFGVAVLIPYKL